MTRTATVLTCLLLFGFAGPGAAQDPARLLREGINKETIGDCDGAIEDYRKVAAATDAALAEQALRRMAGCYDKLGNAQAAADARARLGEPSVDAGGSAGEPAQQTVWERPAGLPWGVSADGRYVAYGSGPTGAVLRRDLVTSQDLVVVPTADSGHAEYTAISRDASRIAYVWWTGDAYQLRIARVGDAPDEQPQVLIADVGAHDIDYLTPYEWSPDGRHIVATLNKGDRSGALALVAVEGGAISQLLSMDWRGASRVFFSPDGRWLLFDTPADETSIQHDVFVIAADGASTSLVRIADGPSHDVAAGWSPDGSTVLFTSDRSDNRDLWGQPLVQGRPAGNSTILRQGVQGESFGVDASGRLLQAVRVSNTGVHIAPFDPATGVATGDARRLPSEYWGASTWPMWSPDGSAVAYESNRARSNVLVIQSIAGDRTREINLPFRLFQQPSWTHDGTAIVANVVDLKGRRSIVRIDAADGSSTEILDGARYEGHPACCSFPQLDRTGKVLYYRNAVPADQQFRFVAHDLATDDVREIFRSPPGSDISMRQPTVSPDGRFVATVESGEVWLAPVEGGDVQILVERSAGANFVNYLRWMPDSSAVIVRQGNPGRQYWLVPIDGTAPRTFSSDGARDITVQPGGRQVAYIAGQSRTDLVRLANFLPAPGR